MQGQPKHTTVVVNTFPKEHMNKMFTPQHGCTVIFTDHEKKTYFQVQLFFRVYDFDTKELLYEFRTCGSYSWDEDLYTPDHPDFLPTAVATIKSAIPDFNWYIKNNDSYLTMNKLYTQNPTIENSDKFIRSAWVRYKTNIR